jgi:hypothetical protein
MRRKQGGSADFPLAFAGCLGYKTASLSPYITDFPNPASGDGELQGENGTKGDFRSVAQW